jgi:hypothetical protein
MFILDHYFTAIYDQAFTIFVKQVGSRKSYSFKDIKNTNMLACTCMANGYHIFVILVYLS